MDNSWIWKYIAWSLFCLPCWPQSHWAVYSAEHWQLKAKPKFWWGEQPLSKVLETKILPVSRMCGHSSLNCCARNWFQHAFFILICHCETLMAVEKEYHFKRHKAKKLRIFERPFKLVFRENTKTFRCPWKM